MKTYAYILCAALAVPLAGCGNFFGASERTLEGYDVGPYPEAAYVFVEGENRGVTPATIRIRRGFSESTVSVHQKGEVVRTYLLEQGNSSNRNELVYSFSDTSSQGIPTYHVEDLNVTSKGEVIIPYFGYPIAIMDRQFDLTLLIAE